MKRVTQYIALAIAIAIFVATPVSAADELPDTCYGVGNVDLIDDT